MRSGNRWDKRFMSYKEMQSHLNSECRTSEIAGNKKISFKLCRENDAPNDTTKWWRSHKVTYTDDLSLPISSETSKGRIGFITSMSSNFCASCNRLRLMADGKIKVSFCTFVTENKHPFTSILYLLLLKSNFTNDLLNGMCKVCLFGSEEVSLRDALREPSCSDKDLQTLIRVALLDKKFALGGHKDMHGIAASVGNRPMTLIGG